MRAEKATTLRYHREGDLVRLTINNMSNHELREVLIGLWCRLDLGDRVDHFAELHHYLNDTGAFLSTVAAAVKSDPGTNGVVDLAALAARGENVAP